MLGLGLNACCVLYCPHVFKPARPATHFFAFSGERKESARRAQGLRLARREESDAPHALTLCLPRPDNVPVAQAICVCIQKK